MGFTYKVEYEIQDANGNPLFIGTEEDLKKKLAELGKNFYTSSDATIAVEESGLNISDSGLNQSQYGKTLSLVSKYSNENILDENGDVTDKAQKAVSELKTFYDQLI
jgi:chromosome segregation ATPase